MASFSIVDRQPGGCTGVLSIGNVGEAVEIWTIIGDDVTYTTEDLRESDIFPEVYESFHLQNPHMQLQPIEIDQDKENPALFICTLRWSSVKTFLHKARISVTTAFGKETKHRDFYGKPKVNAAGDLFDPPIENNTTWRIITIRKQVEVFPDWMFEYADAVNSLPFVIKGRTIEKGLAWMANITLGEENLDGPTPTAEATIEIHVKKKRKYVPVIETPESVPDPWETEQLNEGLMFLKPVYPPTDPPTYTRHRIKVKDEDGNDVNAPSPVPLTTLGAVLDPVTIDNPNFIVFRDHEEMDFNALSYLWSDD
jgi:hypothetical protein